MQYSTYLELVELFVNRWVMDFSWVLVEVVDKV